MGHPPIDPDFERYVAEGLRAYAEEGREPFDAVEIAHYAARGQERRGRAPGGVPRSVRWAVVSSAAVVLLAATAFAAGLLPLPDAELGPSPTLAGLHSPTVTAEPDGATLPPIIDPDLTPLPGPPDPDATPVAPATDEPWPTDMAAGPDDTPPTEPTDDPGVSPPPSPDDASPSPEPPASPTPAPLTAVHIAAGSGHACAVRSDRTVVCWGDNSAGELGDGTTTARSVGNLPVVGIDDAVHVAAGTRFSCAVRSDGSVWCWGEDAQGDGGSLTPVRVEGVRNATAVTAGGAHACALHANGRVTCWGLGSLGQLGNGSIIHNEGNPPVAVVGIDDARQISAGWNHTCALRSDRTVWCWGGNGDGATGYGQIGDGTFESAPAPVQVGGISDAAQVAAGGWSTCALLRDGSAWCWGYGERGGLGDGQNQNSSTPVRVSDLANVRQLAVGGWHACAIGGRGRVWCWGANSHGSAGGQLGDGTHTDRATPVRVFALQGAQGLTAGWLDTFAIDANGNVQGWGAGWGHSPREVHIQ